MARSVTDARFRLLVESAVEFGVITMDDSGVIETWNTGAEHLFGWRPDEAIGRLGSIIFTPEDAAAGVPEREIDTAKAEGRAIDER
ncbi:MAG TPA: PAS domain S-box protein, partial [Gemmatimonadales bacterium]|nr:PAS domain S-box protein [Gemmatimonadales bacterium]